MTVVTYYNYYPKILVENFDENSQNKWMHDRDEGFFLNSTESCVSGFG